MKRALPVAAVVALIFCGCGSGTARVKGKIVENGQPRQFAPFSASVQFAKIGDDGRPDPTKMYSAVVEADGSFELVASGGELPAGMYQVAIEMPVKKGERNSFAPPDSAVRRELKSGSNELTIDLAKPEGCWAVQKRPRAAHMGGPRHLPTPPATLRPWGRPGRAPRPVS